MRLRLAAIFSPPYVAAQPLSRVLRSARQQPILNINNLVLARWISTQAVDTLALLHAAHNARLRRPLTVRVIVPIPKGYPYHNATVF